MPRFNIRMRPPLARHETTHPTAAQARKAAERCGFPNVEYDAAETEEGWVGVVYIRSDQRWMRDVIHDHGCRLELRP